MAYYLSSRLYKHIPSINAKMVGWNDDKGYELKEVAVSASNRYFSEMKTSSRYADAFASQISEVDSFLSKSEPRLKTL